jgi:hypothetical protein
MFTASYPSGEFCGVDFLFFCLFSWDVLMLSISGLSNYLGPEHTYSDWLFFPIKHISCIFICLVLRLRPRFSVQCMSTVTPRIIHGCAYFSVIFAISLYCYQVFCHSFVIQAWCPSFCNNRDDEIGIALPYGSGITWRVRLKHGVCFYKIRNTPPPNPHPYVMYVSRRNLCQTSEKRKIDKKVRSCARKLLSYATPHDAWFIIHLGDAVRRIFKLHHVSPVDWLTGTILSWPTCLL